ncbi:MAG: LacI family DNA-binding transcriptional regulator [Planctomycetota bacterium]|nr:LacI family DNA-binding transcriptional regulator [Planctomycetota bacterium]
MKKKIKKTSLADIAKALGVSKTLVSMVLNDKGNENGINADTQKRVWAKARELDYKPNMMARSLRMGRSNTIGLIVADISNIFYARLCRAVEDAASKHSYHVLFSSSDENADKERKLIQTLRERQADGLIISTTLEEKDVDKLHEQNVPFVLVDRFIPNSKTPFVTADNYGGSLALTEHLIKIGIEKIALFTISPSHLTSITERARGYKDALLKHNLPFHPELIREIPYDDIKNSVRRELTRLLRPPHSIHGLFVSNNNIAKATLEILEDLRLRIPRDVSLVCFDDIDMFRHTDPPITAVAQPVERMGQKAVEILLDKLKNGKKARKKDQIFLKTKVIPRRSCGSFLRKS